MRKREWIPDVKASFPTDFHSLFLSALRMRWLRHRPAALLCGYARGGTPFRCGETSGFYYRAAAAKTAITRRTPYQSGSLRSAAPRACEARRKRTGEIGASLLAAVFSGSFRYRLPRYNCRQLPISTQVLCFFLDSRNKRSPRSLSLCVTSSRRGFPCIRVQPRPPRQSVPSPRPCCIPLHHWHRRDRRRDNARQLH